MFSRYAWFTYHSDGSKLRRVDITVSLETPRLLAVLRTPLPFTVRK